MRVRYIMKSIEKRDRAVYGSIPAMRVRYIFHVRYTTSPRPGSIPAMRVRYIDSFDVERLPEPGFNSRYAGKIHRVVSLNCKEVLYGSIPAMRVRYIGKTLSMIQYAYGSIPAMRVRYISKNNGKHCH